LFIYVNFCGGFSKYSSTISRLLVGFFPHPILPLRLVSPRSINLNTLINFHGSFFFYPNISFFVLGALIAAKTKKKQQFNYNNKQQTATNTSGISEIDIVTLCNL